MTPGPCIPAVEGAGRFRINGLRSLRRVHEIAHGRLQCRGIRFCIRHTEPSRDGTAPPTAERQTPRYARLK